MGCDQSAPELIHIGSRGCEGDAVLLIVAEGGAVHYEYRCHLVLYALCAPFSDIFVFAHDLKFVKNAVFSYL